MQHAFVAYLFFRPAPQKSVHSRKEAVFFEDASPHRAYSAFNFDVECLYYMLALSVGVNSEVSLRCESAPAHSH